MDTAASLSAAVGNEVFGDPPGNQRGSDYLNTNRELVVEKIHELGADPELRREVNLAVRAKLTLAFLKNPGVLLTRALELDPRYALARISKGLVQELLGRAQDAVLSYKQFIALALPQDAEQVEYAQQRIRELEGK